MIRYNDCEFPRFTEPQTKATKQFAIMTHRYKKGLHQNAILIQPGS